MKKIEMLVTFDNKGILHPFRFRLEAEDESLVVINIDHVLFKEVDRKEETIKFRCTCKINNLKRTVDIYYNKYVMEWYLDL